MSTGHNSKFVGKVLKRFETLPSTNAYALEVLTRENVMEGTVFITYNQTHGRGQRGTRWVSEKGKNIALSVVLRPAFLPLTDQFYLNKAVSLAVHRSVSGYFPDTSIKWPNDIYVKDRKIAGILMQSVVQGAGIKVAVIGIGLNVNQTVFGEEAPNATSMALEGGRNLDILDVEEQLFSELDTFYTMLKRDTYSLDQLYGEALYRRGDQCRFQKIPGGKEFVGMIENVDGAGKLKVRALEGGIEFFNLKELRFV